MLKDQSAPFNELTVIDWINFIFHLAKNSDGVEGEEGQCEAASQAWSPRFVEHKHFKIFRFNLSSTASYYAI